MSLQLRSLVIESLQDLFYFFTTHEVWTTLVVLYNFISLQLWERRGVPESTLTVFCVLQGGNDFGEVFDEMKYVKSHVLLVELQVNEPHIDFSPSFQHYWELIHGGFMEIIKSAEKLLRVQFPLKT